MSELFGVSMNLIMFVLLAILFVGLASVGLIALRNRVMFRLGVRNIPRRRAQTILIVVGLMLSTVIISAAFTTGDTVDRSVTSQVYRLLGSVDETIVAGQREEDEAFGDENDTALRDASFDSTAVAPLIARLRQSPDVDAVIPTYGGIAVAVNLEERLSSPLFTLIGLDAAAARNLPDLKALGSGRVGVGELGAGEIYLNRSAAEDLNLAAGDSVTLFTEATTTVFVVRAVIEDGRLAGSVGISTQREGGVAPLTVAQSFFGAEGKLTMIAVSNRGDARGGYFLSPTVEEQIDAALPPETELTVQPVKRLGVDLAEEFGNIFTTFFLAFGLFSIGAGVLLIFMIFVMLATERKSEMGMARAVGTKRMDLVQTFISEGMAYNVAAAMVGTAIGILVAVVIAKVMGSVFEAANLDISPHVTLRSLVVSYSLGVVLTFLTVTFASWRISLINIVRAIRDIPDPPQPVPQWGSRGVLATLRDLNLQASGSDGLAATGRRRPRGSARRGRRRRGVATVDHCGAALRRRALQPRLVAAVAAAPDEGGRLHRLPARSAVLDRRGNLHDLPARAPLPRRRRGDPRDLHRRRLGVCLRPPLRPLPGAAGAGADPAVVRRQRALYLHPARRLPDLHLGVRRLGYRLRLRDHLGDLRRGGRRHRDVLHQRRHGDAGRDLPRRLQRRPRPEAADPRRALARRAAALDQDGRGLPARQQDAHRHDHGDVLPRHLRADRHLIHEPQLHPPLPRRQRSRRLGHLRRREPEQPARRPQDGAERSRLAGGREHRGDRPRRDGDPAQRISLPDKAHPSLRHGGGARRRQV